MVPLLHPTDSFNPAHQFIDNESKYDESSEPLSASSTHASDSDTVLTRIAFQESNEQGAGVHEGGVISDSITSGSLPHVHLAPRSPLPVRPTQSIHSTNPFAALSDTTELDNVDNTPVSSVSVSSSSLVPVSLSLPVLLPGTYCYCYFPYTGAYSYCSIQSVDSCDSIKFSCSTVIYSF